MVRKRVAQEAHAMRNDALTVIAAAALAAADMVYADQNLLRNGDLSSSNQLINWSCGGSTGSSVAWSSDDAASLGSSGSMELTASAYYDPNVMMTNPGLASCASACFAVGHSVPYTTGGQSRLVSGVAGLDVITFACNAYTTAANCSGAYTTLNSPSMSTSVTWSNTPDEISGTLPSAAQSVRCTATVLSALSTGSGHLDNLFFRSDLVFVNGFEPQ